MKLLEIEGEQVSLNDIEHRILRPVWRDPRVHYALNCASLGCPNLQPHAFTRDLLERLLNSAARAFINHKRGVRFEGKQLVVASIYQWFQVDFGESEASVIQHLIQYAEPELAKQLKSYQGSRKHQYDWNLNSPDE
ncbi:DUF547 domain-containing protein [Deltaproteobacteria bacterium TL4]